MIRSPEILFLTLLLIYHGSQVESNASDHRYVDGDTVPFYADIIGPYFNPWETYPYYDLPFCSPDPVKEKKLNLGEMLNGNHLVSTPYKFEFLVDKKIAVLCNKTLSKTDVSRFRRAIDDNYYMQLFYDDLPVWAFVGQVESHFRDEHVDKKYILYKHFNFEIMYNKDRVIQVNLSVDHGLEMAEDKEVDVDFTYSVTWLATQISFDKRMEIYIDYTFSPQNLSIRRHSIRNSSVILVVLTICLSAFYVLVLRKEISMNSRDLEEEQVADNQDEKGWKNIHGDVFRFPQNKSLFAAALGSGTQLLVIIVAILVLGFIGFLKPYLRGTFSNTLVIVYAVTSVVSGYTSVSFYRQLEGTHWVKTLLVTGGLYFGPLFLTFCFLNSVSISYGTTAALPLRAIVMLSLLWIFLASPLLLLGAIVGKNITSDFQAPCKTAKIPREVPQLRWYRGVLPQMAFAGILPSSVVFTLFTTYFQVFGAFVFTPFTAFCWWFSFFF